MYFRSRAGGPRSLRPSPPRGEIPAERNVLKVSATPTMRNRGASPHKTPEHPSVFGALLCRWRASCARGQTRADIVRTPTRVERRGMGRTELAAAGSSSCFEDERMTRELQHFETFPHGAVQSALGPRAFVHRIGGGLKWASPPSAPTHTGGRTAGAGAADARGGGLGALCAAPLDPLREVGRKAARRTSSPRRLPAVASRRRRLPPTGPIRLR